MNDKSLTVRIPKDLHRALEAKRRLLQHDRQEMVSIGDVVRECLKSGTADVRQMESDALTSGSVDG